MMSMPPPGSDPNDPVVPPPAFGTQPPPAFGTQPPPGYVSYNQAGGYLGAVSLTSTTGLRKWASGLFILVTALTGLSTWAQFSRIGIIDDFIDGTGTIFDIDDADQIVFATGVLEILAIIAAAIVVCIWTLRSVRNAEALVGRGLKPGLAAGGWFIPIGNLWVSFAKLRQALRPLHGSTGNTSWWQGLWIVGVFAGNASFRSDALNQPTIEGVRDGLSSVANTSAFGTVVMALATVFAIRAMRDFETAVSTRHARNSA